MLLVLHTSHFESFSKGYSTWLVSFGFYSELFVLIDELKSHPWTNPFSADDRYQNPDDGPYALSRSAQRESRLLKGRTRVEREGRSSG